MSDKALPAGEGLGKSVIITRADTLEACALLQANNLCVNAKYYEEHGALMPEEEHDALFDKMCVQHGVDLANPLRQYKVSLAEYLSNFAAAREFILATYAPGFTDACALRIRRMSETYATGTWNDLPEHSKETA